MIDVLRNISEMHQKNSAKNARNYDLCRRYGKISQLIATGIPIFYLSIIIVYQLPACFDILTKGIIRPSMNIYLPDIDEFDTIDMSLLFVINVAFVTYTIIIPIASDIFIYINFSTVPLFSTIIQRQINDFKNELRDKKTANNLKLIQKQLIEIIKAQKTYNE